jgi:hypothetical protein
MLPGFRFLFTAIVLSLSVLVFGLGAAALLRAAHEEFASNPFWHAAPETKFAQPNEPTGPVLAMLRVEPVATEQKASDDVAATLAPAEPAAIAPRPAEPEQIAALKPEQTSPPELPTPAVPSSAPAGSEAAPAPPETSEAGGEAKVATSEQVLPPGSAAPAASEQGSPPASPVTDPSSTNIATLGGTPVSIEASSPTKAASETLDAAAIKKRQQARRAAHRRRMAARARQAQLAIQQQAADPFGQQLLQPAAAAARSH